MAIARRGSSLLLLLAACAGHPNGVRPAGDATGDDGGSPIVGPDASPDAGPSSVSSAFGNAILDGAGVAHVLYPTPDGSARWFVLDGTTVRATDVGGAVAWETTVSAGALELFGGFDFDADGWTDLGISFATASSPAQVCGACRAGCVACEAGECVMTQTWLDFVSGRAGRLVAGSVQPLVDTCFGSGSSAYPSRQWTSLGVLFGPASPDLVLLPYYATTGWGFAYRDGGFQSDFSLYYPSTSFFDATYDADRLNAYAQLDPTHFGATSYVANAHIANGLLSAVGAEPRLTFFTTARAASYRLEAMGGSQLAADAPFLTASRTDLGGRNYGLVAADPADPTSLVLLSATDGVTLFNDLRNGFHTGSGCSAACTGCMAQQVGDDEWGQIERHISRYDLGANTVDDRFFSNAHDGCDAYKYEQRILYPANPFVRVAGAPSRLAYSVYQGGHWVIHISSPGGLDDATTLQGFVLWDVADLDADGVDELVASPTEPAGVTDTGYYLPSWETVTFVWQEGAGLSTEGRYEGVPFLAAAFREPARTTSRGQLYPALVTVDDAGARQLVVAKPVNPSAPSLSPL